MKKGLLIGLFGLGTALSASAFQLDEFVNAQVGRYQITGENIYQASETALDGWSPISATEGKTVQELYYNTSGVLNSASGAATEGMYYKLENLEIGSSYVVSLNIRQTTGTWPYSTNVLKDGSSTEDTNVFGCIDANKNYVNVIYNSGTAYNSAADYESFGKAAQLSADYSAITIAIPEVKSGSYYLVLKGVNPSVDITGIQIQKAVSVADPRTAEAAVSVAKAYQSCFNWTEDQLEGVAENLAAVEALIEVPGTTPEDLADAVSGLNDAIAEFETSNMENFLSACAANTDWNLCTTKAQKMSSHGDWQLSNGRWYHCNSNDAATRESTKFRIDGPSYGYGYAPLGDQYCKMTKALNPGGYVFCIQGMAPTNYNKPANTGGNGYYANEGHNSGYMTLYFMSEAGDTIAAKQYKLDADTYLTGVIGVSIETAGNYEIGVKLQQPVNDYYATATLGGSYYLAYPKLYNHNAGYSAAQLAYEANVRTQITTGRTNLTDAAANLANVEKPWGKAELQACVDSVETKIAAYEKLDQDAIIKTMPEEYASGVADVAVSGLQAEVYLEAVKDIIAANRSFTAKNDTLASMQTVIANAEATLAMRIYDSATGKADLQAVIASAKALQAEMKAGDYSLENAAAIVAKNKEVNEGVETFKNTIPESAITSILNVDFTDAVVTVEGDAATIATNGINMNVSYFSENTPTADSKGVGEMRYELGIDSNGEKLLGDVLRVGNGTATISGVDCGELGTNIVKVSMDWWFIRLSAGYVGFYVKNDANENVSGLYFNPYQQATDALYDPCGIQNGQAYFIANTTGDAGSCADNNKTHVELILDFGAKSQYITTTTPSGTFTSPVVELSAESIAAIEISSNYKNYIGRRCWMDNLKVEKIKAGAADGIREISAANAKAATVKVLSNGQMVINANGKAFNAAGARIK